jgi:predicted permease
MAEQSTNRKPRSWHQGLLALGVLGLAIFAAGAVIGYCRGALREGGSHEMGLAWAAKTGVLLLLMSATIGVFGGLILSRISLPSYLGWAIMFSIAFAMMNGGGVIMGIGDADFWPSTIAGLLQGAVIGAIAGPLIQRSQKRRSRADESLPDDL